MSNNNISDVVDVTIAIESPATDSASFSNLLLIVPQPANVGDEEMSGVVEIKSVKDITVFGYTETDEAYKAVSVAFNQDMRPEKIYLIARMSELESTETVPDCLDRALAKNEWYGFSLVNFSSNTDIEAAAKWAESNGKLFGFTYTSGNCPIDVTAYNNTFAFFAGDLKASQIPDGNKYAAVAYMAKCFSYDPGKETWGLKTLRGVTASNLSTTKVETLKNGNVNFYRSIANKDVTQEGKVGSGEWIDVIRFKEWLINKVQIEVFNYMIKNPKVSFNDAGITGIQNVIESVLAGAQGGGIDEDRYDDEGNLLRGYIITVPKSVDISAADKKNRSLKGISFVARLTGAIHETHIKGTLVY